MALEPHHVLGVEPPTLLLECFSCQVLRLTPLHVVENEEERFRRQPLEELQCICMLQRSLEILHTFRVEYKETLHHVQSVSSTKYGISMSQLDKTITIQNI